MLQTVGKPDDRYVELMSRMFGESETLESIEIAVWLILVLLLFWSISVIFRERKANRQVEKEEPDWNVVVEQEYEKGNYAEALEALATYGLIFTHSAHITYWQGRCYFQLQDWAKAVEKFEECARREPPYRKLVRDYMAFIELNELVPGVEGYLDKL